MAFPHIESQRYEDTLPMLVEADLDRQIAARRAALLPASCDQQGRHETRPMPAECCTEVGADDLDPKARAVFLTAYLAIVAACIVAASAAFF